MEQLWTTREQHYLQTFKYLHGRLKGEITSLQTPWPKLNDIGVAGWEWGSAVAMCARPGVGKSVFAEQLNRTINALNLNVPLRKLRFELEMPGQVNAIREFSAVLKKSYAYLCSAEEEVLLNEWGHVTNFKKKLSVEELQECWQYFKNKMIKDAGGNLLYPEDVVEKSPTVEEFVQIVHAYMRAHSKVITRPDGKKETQYTPTVVTIDHLRLLKKEGKQAELNMLYDACIEITRLKRQYNYPIIFLVLNHVVRDINSDERTKEGTIGNFLRDSDIFGADAIMQNFDIVKVWDRPKTRHIDIYGPQRFIVEDNTLVCQAVKVRNGNPMMLFFEGNFHRMSIDECDPPKQQQKTGK